jgi:hypothetical protein
VPQKREAGIGGITATQRRDLLRQVVEPARHLAGVRPLALHGPRRGDRAVEAVRTLGLAHGEHRPPARPGVIIRGGGQGTARLCRVVERLQGGGQGRARGAVAEGGREGQQRHLAPARGVAAGRGGSCCGREAIRHSGNASAVVLHPYPGDVTRW